MFMAEQAANKFLAEIAKGNSGTKKADSHQLGDEDCSQNLLFIPFVYNEEIGGM